MDPQEITNRLNRLSQLTGGDKPDKKKPIDIDRQLAVLASYYGYDAWLDAKTDKMTMRDFNLLIEEARRKHSEDMIRLAQAIRIGNADKKDYDRLMKQLTKEAGL